MNKKLKEEVKLHLKDILQECSNCRERVDLEQIEHNVFEIAEHLNINLD